MTQSLDTINLTQSLKGGLRHDQERIISSTDVQVDFTIQVKQVLRLNLLAIKFARAECAEMKRSGIHKDK